MGTTVASEALDLRVYSTLRDAILNRKMLPGTKISILALSKELGVSRTPIRLAMQRLSTEGLIVMRSNQTPMVAKPSLKSAKEIFYMRTLLEPAAASLAARFAPAAEVNKLRAAIEKEKLMLKSRNFLDYLNVNTQTHCLIAEMARNEALKATIMQFLDKSTIILSLFDPFYNYSEKEIYVDYDEGLAILEAIRMKNEDLAAERMKSHIMRAFNALPLDSLEEVALVFPRLK